MSAIEINNLIPVGLRGETQAYTVGFAAPACRQTGYTYGYAIAVPAGLFTIACADVEN